MNSVRVLQICLIFVTFLLGLYCKKKSKNDITKSAQDLLFKEQTRQQKSKIECDKKKISLKIIDHLRLEGQNDQVLACCVKYLDSKPDSGWVWSTLGNTYQYLGRTSAATTCFKQALKLSGKLSSYIKEWHFIGPFGIGKIEVDGDPLEDFGGILEVNRKRYKKDETFYSELLDGGVIHWSTYRQTSVGEVIKISPSINWNELVGSLGSLGITEWQGWAVGDFMVNDDHLNVNIQCHGMHTVYIDGTRPVTGDVYHRDDFWFTTPLTRGIHSIFIRLRTKGVQVFKCLIRQEPDNFQISKPRYLPDLYNGHLFSEYIPLLVTNLHFSKWLKVTKCTLSDQSTGTNIEASLFTKGFMNQVAPGQTRPINIKLISKDDKITDVCEDVHFKLKLSTTMGHVQFPITLRCRKAGESFLFTFLDHDGSIQHAAAIEPIKGCENKICSVLLTLHGTTVPPQNQADSYKRMVGGNFVFGFDHLWVLAPTRHGAHNWEGPGTLTAMTALDALSSLSSAKTWMKNSASDQHVIIAGHSMGGHGAWNLATHYPDRVQAVISLAGWIKKEEYGDSNLFFRHDISSSSVDPAVKQVLEACIAENDADRHISNIQHLPVLARIGANDRTVHPYYVRRMYRLLKKWDVDVTYSELQGKEHWWWDTRETNDGGAVNDQQLRDFTNKHSATIKHVPVCSSNEHSCDVETSSGKYSKLKNINSFVLTVMNPTLGESLHGIRILQQVIPFRTSLAKGKIEDGTLFLTTINVLSFDISKISFPWQSLKVQVDKNIITQDVLTTIMEGDAIHLCRPKDSWQSCELDMKARYPDTLGPARRIAENALVIVIGTQGGVDIQSAIQEMAVYIANLFFLTSDAAVSIVKDTELADMDILEDNNVIILGGPQENSYTERYLEKIPISTTKTGFQMGGCNFTEARTGALFLAPSTGRRLALILMGNSLEGLQDVVSLATPTIPPMTRSPFSNLVPDFIITGPEYRASGPGGYKCAGFWGNNWELRPELISCSC